ncbi:hypothetical protein EZV62_009182 [Acer yangbiense]|uniref:Tryptophan synthase n=1 Tax=Acer yangbiense TaxID=1000413 RepID=A0A5C7IEY3_9ROSI|nr:hypothetical protein EZV62_009182 [Acer yangbiense]
MPLLKLCLLSVWVNNALLLKLELVSMKLQRLLFVHGLVWSLNVFRMRLLGAEARAIHSGTATLKDATSEAIRGLGGGSNAMGLFHEFVNDKDVRLIGVEAAGHGLDSGKHAATLTKGEVGVLHGAMSYLLQDDDGQIVEPHSISAGLDYLGVGPEHSFLKDEGRHR